MPSVCTAYDRQVDAPEKRRAPRQRPVAQGQLGLADLEPATNPNAHLYDEHGKPRRLLWCSDTARMGGPCPYTGERARFRPTGGCCKDLAAAPPPGRPLDGRAHAAAQDTEQAAAGRESFGGRRTQRVRVLEWFEEHPDGSTDHEVALGLGIVRPHVAGTRREELIRDGHMIVASSDRRATDTGSPAIVWKLIRF